MFETLDVRKWSKRTKIITSSLAGGVLVCGAILALAIQPVEVKTAEKTVPTTEKWVEESNELDNILPDKKEDKPSSSRKSSLKDKRNDDSIISFLDDILPSSKGQSPLFFTGDSSSRDLAMATLKKEKKATTKIEADVGDEGNGNSRPTPPVVAPPPPVIDDGGTIVPPPIITSIPVIQAYNAVIEKGTSFNASSYVSVSDSMDSDPKVFIDTSDVNTSKSGVYMVVVNAVNYFGNSAEAVRFSVTVVAPPKIIVASASRVIPIGIKMDVKELVTAHDDLDGDLTKKVMVIRNDIDFDVEGIYDVAFEVTNSYGFKTSKSFSVTVKNEAPTLIAKDIIHEIGQPFNSLDGVSAIAFNGEKIDVTLENIVSSNIDPLSEGIYEEEYQVTDRFGKESAIVKRTVTVENEAPLVTLPDYTIKVGETFVEADYLSQIVITDREDDKTGETVKVTLDTSAVDTQTAGSYDVIITATDSMGKETIVTGHVVILGLNEEIEEPPAPIEEDHTELADSDSIIEDGGKND